MKNQTIFKFRLTKQEREIIAFMAEQQGINESALVRGLIHQAGKRYGMKIPQRHREYARRNERASIAVNEV